MATTDLRHVSSINEGGKSTLTSPLVTRPKWLEVHGRPCVMRMELPIAAGEMVATLYGKHGWVRQGDLEDEDDEWMHVALVLVQDGLVQIAQLADTLIEQEQAGGLAAGR